MRRRCDRPDRLDDLLRHLEPVVDIRHDARRVARAVVGRMRPMRRRVRTRSPGGAAVRRRVRALVLLRDLADVGCPRRGQAPARVAVLEQHEEVVVVELAEVQGLR